MPLLRDQLSLQRATGTLVQPLPHSILPRLERPEGERPASEERARASDFVFVVHLVATSDGGREVLVGSWTGRFASFGGAEFRCCVPTLASFLGEHEALDAAFELLTLRVWVSRGQQALVRLLDQRSYELAFHRGLLARWWGEERTVELHAELDGDDLTTVAFRLLECK